MDARAFSTYRDEIARAEALLSRREHHSAFELYERLLQERLRGGAALEIDADMVVADRLAYLATLFGQEEAADNLLAAMAAASTEVGNRYSADYYTIKRVLLALARGAITQAYTTLDTMASIGAVSDLDISEAGLSVWEMACRWPGTDADGRATLFASLYLAFGQLLSATGQYGPACIAIARGLEHTRPGMPELARVHAVPMRIVRAGALLESGALSQAEDELGAVRPAIDTTLHPGFHVDWLELAAKLHMLHGQFGAALRRIEEVLQIARRGGFPHAQVGAMLNLAHLRIALNQTAAAAEMLASARSAARLLGDSAGAARATQLLALAQARGRSFAADVPLAPSVTAMWDAARHETTSNIEPDPELADLPQPASFLALFEDRALAVKCRLARYDAVGARTMLAQLREVFEPSDSMLIASRLLVLEGIVAYYHLAWSDAEAMVARGVESLRAMGAKAELWQALRFLSWTRTHLGRPDPAIDREADALLHDMSVSLEGVERSIFLLNKWTAEEEELLREVDEITRLKGTTAASAWYARPFLTWRLAHAIHRLMWHIDRHKALCAQRVTRDTDAPPGHASNPPSLFRRLFGTPRSVATVAFLVLPDRTVIASACGLRLRFGVTPITRIQLRDAVREWHEELRKPFLDEPGAAAATDGVERLRDPPANLSDITQLATLAEMLPHRVATLAVVPDDVLHGIPFAALPYRNGYLVERFTLSVRFASLPDRPAASRSPRRRALLVGVTRATPSYPALPGVQDEIDHVEGVLKGHAWYVSVMMDQRAQKPTVLAQIPGASLVHMACHGTFEPDRPDRSGLVLLAPSGDDTLTLRDLAELDLSTVEHATLSACWSSDNFVLPGRWIVSLPETLVRAGVRSVVGSLWPVPDDTTAEFMATFYDALAKLGADGATRKAQLAFIRGQTSGKEDVASAPNWAGFAAYGDAGRIAW
jgi:CHAT domain-containing protein